MIFDTYVNGIPCKCEVHSYSPYVPMRITGSGQGDADPPELEEFDFQILDRRNKPAPWLEKYLTPHDEERLCEEYRDSCKAEDYSFY